MTCDVRQKADREHVHNERGTADGNERKRNAGHGQHADHSTDIQRRLTRDPGRDASGKQHRVPIRCAPSDAKADKTEAREQPDDGKRSYEAEFFADHGKDEIGVRIRQEPPLRSPGDP